MTTFRESLEAVLANPGEAALRRLAKALEPLSGNLLSRCEASALTLDDGAGEGPCVRYVLAPPGAWLTLSWQPGAAAAAARSSMPIEPDQRFLRGPLTFQLCPDLGEAVVIGTAYDAGELPGEHRLLNDLQAMMMLRELMAQG